ncbi:hypothetical protein T06_538 [Trichinella sp. T6]|nr:hypothetical protein T06_538 [Trichinella sp. T6]
MSLSLFEVEMNNEESNSDFVCADMKNVGLARANLLFQNEAVIKLLSLVLHVFKIDLPQS